MRLLVVLAAAVLAPGALCADYSTRLKALGYRQSEINSIKPSVARVVARRGLPRPKSGMPESWRVAPLPKKKPLFSRAFKAVKFTAMLALRVVLPLGLVLAFGSDVVDFLKATWTHVANNLSAVTARRQTTKKKKVKRRQDDEESFSFPTKKQLDHQRPPPPPKRESLFVQEELVLDGPDDRSLRR